MATVMMFNPRKPSAGRGAERIASRRTAVGAGVYRPSFAKGHAASDSVRERLVRYRIAKPASGKRVLLNEGSADAENPAKKTRAKKAAKPAKAKKAKGQAKAAWKRRARKNSAPVVTTPSGAGSLVAARNGKRKGGKRGSSKRVRDEKPSISADEARAVLRQGYVMIGGKRRKLTAKQKRFFGWVAGGAKARKGTKKTRKSGSAKAVSAKAKRKAKTAQKATATRRGSKMAKKKTRAKGRKKVAAGKRKASRRKKTSKVRKVHGKKKRKSKAKGGLRKAARRPKKRKSKARRKTKRNDLVAAANKPKKRRKKGGKRKARRNDLVAAANKPKKRRKKAKSRRRNDGAVSTAALQALAKKIAPKYQRAQTSAARKRAREDAQRAALNEVARRLGVDPPSPAPVSTMAKDLARQVSEMGVKMSEGQVRKILASIPKPAESVSVDSAIAKMAQAVEKLASRGGGGSRKSRKSRKSKSRKSSRKSKARRNGKHRKSTAVAKGGKKRRKSKAKRSKGRRSKKAKGGRKGRRSKKTRRNAGFPGMDLVRKIPGGEQVEKYVGDLREVGMNYLPGGLAGLVGAYGVPSLAFQFLPAQYQGYNQGWWGVFTSAVGVGVAAAATGFVASKVQPGSARKQTIGAVLGGSLAIATRVISALTAPSNPIRRAIGTDSSRLADWAGMNDLAPDYLGDFALANSGGDVMDLDYGQAGDQIGMTADEGISDFAAPEQMHDFASPALGQYAAPGSRDDTLSGSVPVTDFALGDGADEMGQSDVDDGAGLDDFVEVAR